MDALKAQATEAAPTMSAIRLHPPGTLADLVAESIETPRLQSGEALVEVQAAAITRDELSWPAERLPAIPSYELSGVVVAVAPDVHIVNIGEPVFALTHSTATAAPRAMLPCPRISSHPCRAPSNTSRPRRYPSPP